MTASILLVLEVLALIPVSARTVESQPGEVDEIQHTLKAIERSQYSD